MTIVILQTVVNTGQGPENHYNFKKIVKILYLLSLHGNAQITVCLTKQRGDHISKDLITQHQVQWCTNCNDECQHYNHGLWCSRLAWTSSVMHCHGKIDKEDTKEPCCCQGQSVLNQDNVNPTVNRGVMVQFFKLVRNTTVQTVTSVYSNNGLVWTLVKS